MDAVSIERGVVDYRTDGAIFPFSTVEKQNLSVFDLSQHAVALKSLYEGSETTIIVFGRNLL
jgi:hypothetical protein